MKNRTIITIVMRSPFLGEGPGGTVAAQLTTLMPDGSLLLLVAFTWDSSEVNEQ